MQKFELANKVQRIIDNQLVVNLQIIETVIKMADGLDDEADRVLMKGICFSIAKALEANKCVLPKDQFELDFMESFNK
jgi:hypothetical protein